MWNGRADDRSRHAQYRVAWDDLSGARRLVQSACLEQQLYPCPDEGTLVALLHHSGLESWSLHRALAELQYGRMAVLLIVLAEVQRQRYCPLSQGTITTAFDTTVLNEMDRFHLVGDAIDRLP